MTDAQAKAILRVWPNRTKKVWAPPAGQGYWLRGRPSAGAVSAPKLHAPGAQLFHTQPDGLYLYLHEHYADAICIEVCNTIQNLNDKRSRYIPASHSLLVTAPLRWLLEAIGTQHGGQAPRWNAARTFPRRPRQDVTLPVRHLRVLYALPPHHYSAWKANNIPAGYEYFCRQSSLKTYNSQVMQKFLRQMSVTAQFLTR